MQDHTHGSAEELNARLYSHARVRALFDEMAATYGLMNLVSSFGFARRWRRQCLDLAEIAPGSTVYDLMAGMGECLPGIHGRAKHGTVRCLDFSSAMCRGARSTAARLGLGHEVVLEENVLETTLPPSSADRVVSSFGLKTFDPDQLGLLAKKVHELLKPGGRFCFVEISEPPGIFLRAPYLFYLRRVIPVLGFLFLGNPDNYRQLGVYTASFASRRESAQGAFAEAGLEVETFHLFFGCAMGLRGRKAETPRARSGQ